MRDQSDTQTHDWLNATTAAIRDREARVRRDRGIIKALDHADSVTDEWRVTAYKVLLHYLKLRRGQRITAEQFRQFAVWHIPNPPDERAWGGIFQKAARAKLIMKHGYECVTDPKCHKRPGTVWLVP